MKKLNQLFVLVLFLFVALLVSCEKETVVQKQEPIIATEVASIEEVKETFLKQNKSIHLFTGKSKNLQAKGNSISNYFIDWKNTKKVTFKEGVTILSTPVIRQFIDKRERSFVASFKNGDTIEQRFFMVYYKKGIDDSSSFSGYLLKFKIDTEFEALYRYKEGVLVAIYAPQKSKLQHRSAIENCKPVPEEIIDSLEEGDDDYEGEDVVHFDCLLLVATVRFSQANSSSGGGGDGGHGFSYWHNPSRYFDNLLSNMGVGNHSNNHSDKIIGDGGGYNGDSNDVNNSVEKIKLDITFKESVANCAYKLLKDNDQFKKILDKLIPENSEYDVVFQVGESSGNGGYTNSNTDLNVREIYATISKDNLSNSIISIAESILHEAVHVRLFEQIKSIGGLDKLKEFSHLKTEIGRLAACYNKYGPKHNPSQHNFMWKDYVDKIAKGIETIHKLFPQNYEKVHEYMKGTDGYRKETFYKKVVQAGLSKTSYFKNIKGDSIKGSEHNKTQREILNMSSALKAYGKKIKNYKTCQ